MRLLFFNALLLALLTSCTKPTEVETAANNGGASFKMTEINIQIEPRISKGLRGDLTDVGFTIQDKPYHPLIRGGLNCSVDANYVVSCIGLANLATLANRSYRIIVYTNEKPGKEALACDYFEYDKNSSQLNLNINPSSSGECILSQLEADTGLSESEITKRVKHILNADEADEIDLETTLHDLFKYFNGKTKEDWDKSWDYLVAAIKSNTPLPKKHKSTIDGAGRGF